MLSFQILGPVTILGGDGRTLKLSGARPRALLADLLIHANRVVSVDRLVDDLWGERPPSAVRTALHNLVSQLRKTLGPEVLVTSPPGYALLIEPRQLDSVRFEELLSQAAGEESGERIRCLESALALWQGEVLADVFYESFAQPTIIRLEERRTTAIEDLFDAKLGIATSESARGLVADLRAMVETYPYRERLRAQLLSALLLAGRQADALRVYHSWREKLAQEWGVESDLVYLLPPDLTDALGVRPLGVQSDRADGLYGELDYIGSSDNYPIDELELSEGTYTLLRRAGVETVKDLVQLSADEFAEIPNLGSNGIAEIRRALDELGAPFAAGPVTDLLRECPPRYRHLLGALVQAGVDFLLSVPERQEPKLICNPALHQLERLRHALLRLGARTSDGDRIESLADLSAMHQALAIRSGRFSVGSTPLLLEIGNPRSYRAATNHATEARAEGGGWVKVLTGNPPRSNGALSAKR